MKNNSSMHFEFLNKDYLELAESKEYHIGRRVVLVRSLLKKGKIFTLTRKLINFARIQKYNNHPTHCLDINNHINLKNKKIAVFTCMMGDYDYIRKPKYVSDNCDYFIITDMATHYNIFNKVPISRKVKKELSNNPILVSKYYKMHPFTLFENYDYTIYVDSNVEIMSDISKMINNINPDYGLALHASNQRDCVYNEIKAHRILRKGNYKKMKAQANRYKKDKFPKHYGVLECTVMAIDLKNLNAIKILNDWWLEYVKSESLRDQLSLPYVLWKNDVPVIELTGLGPNIYRNSLIRINKRHKNK